MHLCCNKNPCEIDNAWFHPKKFTTSTAFSSWGIVGPVFLNKW